MVQFVATSKRSGYKRYPHHHHYIASDVSHRMRGIEAGANEFIVRPITSTNLIVRMDVLLQLD